MSAHTSERPSGPGLAKCPSFSEDENSNLRAKVQFEARIVAVGLGGRSVRWLADNVFKVPHTTLAERRSRRRLDLAPKEEWFRALNEWADWQRLGSKFGASR